MIDDALSTVKNNSCVTNISENFVHSSSHPHNMWRIAPKINKVCYNR